MKMRQFLLLAALAPVAGATAQSPTSSAILALRGNADTVTLATLSLPDAINIAHTRLPMRLAELPKDQPLLVHCLTGGRAAAAVSFLERSGYRAAVVNGPFSDYRPIGEAAKATA